MILDQCKGVHCVDLGESFQTHIYLQNFVSIQPRTSRDAQQPGPLREQPLRRAGRLRGGGHRRREEEVKAGRGTDVKI